MIFYVNIYNYQSIIKKFDRDFKYYVRKYKFFVIFELFNVKIEKHNEHTKEKKSIFWENIKKNLINHRQV